MLQLSESGLKNPTFFPVLAETIRIFRRTRSGRGDVNGDDMIPVTGVTGVTGLRGDATRLWGVAA